MRGRAARPLAKAAAVAVQQEAEEDAWLNDIGPFTRLRASGTESVLEEPDREAIEDERTISLKTLMADSGVPRSLHSIGPGHPLWPVVRRLSERIWRELRLQLQGEQDDEPIEEPLLVAQVRKRAKALFHVEPGLSALLRNRAEVALLVQSIVNEVLGYGPLAVLLEDEQITEILAAGPHLLYVELDGQMQEIPPRFADERHMERIIENMLRQAGRDPRVVGPVMNIRLPDDTFVTIVLPTGTTNGPTILLRKCPRRPLRLDDLVASGTLSQPMAAFLHACVRERRTIVICGHVGSGRTTLLNALAMCIPTSERIVTVEEVAELRLSQRHTVSLVAPSPADGAEKTTTRDLLLAALHMRPDRLILGECRGEETAELFRALHAGYNGALTTLYARNPRDALARLETLYRLEDPDAPLALIHRQIADALDVIIHLARQRDGSHKVTEIVQVQGMEGDTVKLRSLFVAR
jgi:pilus assembly protein CpaF